MKLVLLGAPGVGKGTQATLLTTKLGVPIISTGPLLRQAVADKTTLGRAAKLMMDAGQLVSDEIILGVIRERLLEKDTAQGFLLDGFPRNLIQAEALDEMLAKLGQSLDLIIKLNLNIDRLMQRLLGRRHCLSCGATYNLFTAPPKMDENCDECGGRLRQRAEDTEELLSTRLRAFDLQTMPVIDYYQERGSLREVQGEGSVNDVFAAMQKVTQETSTLLKDRSAAIRKAARRHQSVKQESPDKSAPKVQEQKSATPVARKTSKVAVKKTAAKKTTAKKTGAKKAPVKKTAIAKKKISTRSAPKKKVVKSTPKKVAKKTARKKVVSKKS